MFNIFVKKSGQTLAIDFNAYPAHVQQHIIEYGLKQKFNDVHSAEEDGTTAWAMVTALQERLLHGELAKRGGTASPVDAKLRSILRKLYSAKIGGKSAEINKLSVDGLAESLATALSKPKERIISHFTAIALKQVEQERVEQQALLANIDID